MKYAILLLVLAACHHSPSPSVDAGETPAPPGSTHGGEVLVANETGTEATVYFAFGADSKVLPAAWSAFCKVDSNLTCHFKLAASAVQILPSNGYLNVTLAFNSNVGCNSTKAELNINNPKWYNTLDVSLVDGYSNKIQITSSAEGHRDVIGPPVGKDGNEKVFGVFPYGCDICTGRQSPPCGIAPGGAGCKAGTQYKPDVPCQYQGITMGGGNAMIRVTLMN